MHTVTKEVVDAFGDVSGDRNPLHFDEAYAASTRFGHRIAHGTILMAYLSALMASTLPGPGTIYVTQHIEFKAPVYIGDTIEVEVTVEEVKDNGFIRLANLIRARNQIVASGYSVVLVDEMRKRS